MSEQLSSEAHLLVVVHRHCSFIGDEALADDAMNSVVKYSILSRSVPNVPRAFEQVTKVAANIAGSSRVHKGMSFRHPTNWVQVPFSQLARWMGTLYRGQFEVVDMSEWRRNAEMLGIEDLIMSYFEVAGGNKLTQPYLWMTWVMYTTGAAAICLS